MILAPGAVKLGGALRGNLHDKIVTQTHTTLAKKIVTAEIFMRLIRSAII